MLGKLVFILFVSIPVLINAQKLTEELNIEPDFGYGFILGHHSYFNFFYDKHPYTYDIKINRHLSGEKEWQRLYRYPRTGFGFHHSCLGNDKYLGHVNAVYKYINIPIVENQWISWNYTIGAGFALVSKYFDTDVNYDNLAIGSRENAYFNLSQDARILLTDKLTFKLSLGITHYSNGSWAQPNAGINLITVNTGISWRVGERAEKLIKEKLELEKKISLSCVVNGGAREITPPTGKKYFISTFSLNLKKQFWRKRNLGFGIDFFYDSSLHDQQMRYEGATCTSMIFYKAGIHISHDLIFGNTSIIMQTGGYFLTEYTSDGYIYSRFGINQRINDHFFVNISLKTHFFSADYIEWGLGYTIF